MCPGDGVYVRVRGGGGRQQPAPTPSRDTLPSHQTAIYYIIVSLTCSMNLLLTTTVCLQILLDINLFLQCDLRL